MSGRTKGRTGIGLVVGSAIEESSSPPFQLPTPIYKSAVSQSEYQQTR